VGPGERVQVALQPEGEGVAFECRVDADIGGGVRGVGASGTGGRVVARGRIGAGRAAR